VRSLTIGDGGALQVADRPVPEPGGGEVRVRVSAAGLNRADLLQRAGRYPAPPGVPADVPGLEFAGTVDALGDGVDGLLPGARVMGIVAGGAQAEYLTVAAAHCAPVPDALDPIAAGGVPEAFITAHDALVSHAGVRPGEAVLIHAVGSGVGTAALRIAKALGATVVGTARTAAKLDRARDLGLDDALLVDGPLDPPALAERITAVGGADVVVDLVGGPYVTADVLAARPLGRVVVVGTLAGGRAEVPLLALMGKRLRVIGTVLRARDTAEKAAATAAFTRDVVPLLAERRIAPVVEDVFPLERAEEGYERLASDATFGKLILDLTA